MPGFAVSVTGCPASIDGPVGVIAPAVRSASTVRGSPEEQTETGVTEESVT